MSQSGKQELDEALANPAALEKRLAAWERRQILKTRLCAGLTVVYFIGASVALWLFFVNPSKAGEAAKTSITFALACVFQGIMTLSSHRQGRAVRTCREALDAGSGCSDRT